MLDFPKKMGFGIRELFKIAKILKNLNFLQKYNPDIATLLGTRAKFSLYWGTHCNFPKKIFLIF